MSKLKLNVITIVLVLTMAMVVAGPALAEQAEQIDVYEKEMLVKSLVFKIGVPYYVVNGQTPGVKMDVAPFIQSGRTFVPVRFLGNALGLDDSKITWDNGTNTATLAGSAATLQLTIGKAQISINGQNKAMDVAPLLASGRTFLPARYVAEGLGYQVGWDEAAQTVVCWPAGEPKPDVASAVNYLVSVVNPTLPQQPKGETLTTRAGYRIPIDTKLVIPKDINELGPGDPNKCELGFGIDLTKSELASQWNDASSILSQKINGQTVNEVMAYVKQKTDWKQVLVFQQWESNGKKIGVNSPGGSDGVQITVWYK
ncbi:hypothetical protein DCCM_3076 [Desulfocucumis palustris]|uniref:Copper amine oxidase-like N-terminal domain-containing protein n=1 Tax=Desulfocucumis palustris TaxID=1898651 RepID=A0A2L2XCK9_9FIRM|nr:copper amine oxidase N-terminal domain-containing protein [Desulfocucumis palustris]GBF33965.1 hypothetical protein DCCM_3076 [Desulfocucumis palustris]